MQQEDEIFLKVQSVFLESYCPEKDAKKVTEFMSTTEVYESFQRIYPSKVYGLEKIAVWLFNNNFELVEMAPLNFKWGLRKKEF